MTSRIYISGILPQTTYTDLGQLLSKIGEVEEIYIPSKSPYSGNFAIARIAGLDIEKTTKTIKALSGSTWKGSKIKLELAHEWYKDRVMREKQEVVHKPQVFLEPKHQPSQNERRTDILRIRKVKGKKILLVSAAPIILHEGREFRPNNFNIVSSKIATKHVFETDLADLRNYEHISSQKKTLLEMDVSKKAGKGVRKGFGMIKLKSSVDCCIDNEVDVVQDDSFQIVAPCVPPCDLLPENLLKERNRALDIISALASKTNLETNTNGNTIPCAISNVNIENNSNFDFCVNDQVVLKNIFAKEGGVLWDNVDNVKDATKAVVWGDINKEDLIFKEAEQFGFDIRDARNSKNASFSFNFGGDSLSRVNLKNVLSHSVNTVPVETPVLFDIQEIWKVAAKFHRKRSLDEIKDNWEDNKKRRLDDFKKKHRDAKRHSRPNKTNAKR